MKRRSAVRAVILVLLLAVALAVAIRFDLPSLLRTLLDRIAAMGWQGAAVFVAVYTLATVLFIPGSILTLGAGLVYGLGPGTLIVSLASTAGAAAACAVGRFLARDWVRRRIAGNERFAAIDEAVGREGWKIVLLTRLSPVFPFNLLNYAYGLTGVSLPAYTAASWAGMLPGTLMYVYIGSLAGSLATLGSEGGPGGALQWAGYIVGLLATVGVTVVVTRIARRALNQHLSGVKP
mgnify:CR=1 FL=1